MPLIRLACVFYAAVFGLALLVGWLADDALLFAGSETAELAPLRDVGVGLVAAAFVIVLSEWLTRNASWADRMAAELGRVLGRRTPAECALLAAVSAVAEEALFRGALQPLLGWVGASLLFGLAHFAPRRELWPWTGFAVLAGLLLGWLFDATGSLIAPITAHFAINAVNLRRLGVRYGSGVGGVGVE